MISREFWYNNELGVFALDWVTFVNPTTSCLLTSVALAIANSIAQGKMEKQRCREVKPMTIRQPRYSKKEFARRGSEIYKS